MIRHILKIIWTERKINLWILLELVIVFCTLWFCTDYLFFMAKRYFEPKGFDVEHVYRINIGMKDGETKENKEQQGESQIDIWTVFDRIKAYPGVENACISFASIPYSNSYTGNSVFFDTISSSARIKEVTPEYFDVFKMNIIHGKAFTWDDVVENKHVVMSPDRNDKFLNMPAGKAQSFYFGQSGDSPDPERLRNVIGVAAKTKWSEYHDYETVIYYPLTKDNSKFGTGEICVRIKPEADNEFISRFTKDMTEQLEIGRYYLSSIESLQERRADFIKGHEFESNMNSMYSILTFVIINTFLAIIGTFWFRTRSRRNEVGIRLAHGASKSNIQAMFTIETLLLLFIASIIGLAICINISAVDILGEMKLPVAERDGTPSVTEYVINYVFTFLMLTIITLFAVWYPATKASKIQPAETLRAE